MANSYKLVVHVPTENADSVREAIGVAQGGVIGKYSHCSFSITGIGRFKPESDANPYIGEVGKLEKIEEERIEITVGKDVVKEVVAAIKEVHPYEEVTIDVYLLEDLS